MSRQRWKGNGPCNVTTLLFLRLIIFTTPFTLTAARVHSHALPFARQFADELTSAANHHDRLNTSLETEKKNQESLEWFVAAAAKQMVDLNSITLNVSASGSLANQFQTCWDSTSAPVPPSARGKDLMEISKDPDLTLKVVHAHLFDVYQNEVRTKELGQQLEECEQSCENLTNATNCTNLTNTSVVDAGEPASDSAPLPSLLAKARKQLRGGSKKKAPGLFDALNPLPKYVVAPDLKPVADAMVHTQHAVETLRENVTQQRAVNSVLEDVAVKAMQRYPSTVKTIEQVQSALKDCLDVQAATQLSANASLSLLNATLSGIPAKNGTGTANSTGNSTPACKANASGNGTAGSNSSCNGTNATAEEDPVQIARFEAMQAAQEQAENATAQKEQALADLRACRRKCNSGDHAGDKMEELARRLAHRKKAQQHQTVYEHLTR